MFCPVCKYEFRRGFTHCNQCDADLVDSLPPEPELNHAAPIPEATLDHPVLLWSGAGAGIFSALTSALENAEIPYNKEDLDARLMFTSQHGNLEIWVPAANLAEAQPILDAVLANPLNTDSLSATALPPEGLFDSALDAESDEDTYDVRRPGAGRPLYPEDATAVVWSGTDPAVAETLKTCLAEIGIACFIHRPDSDDESTSGSQSVSAAGSHSKSDEFAVGVLPEEESRAAQIVRQVVSAAPPE